MLMHASLSASAVIFARPGLSDAQSLVNVLTWAALLWVAASAVVIADRRQRDPLGREVLAHDSARRAAARMRAQRTGREQRAVHAG
jgi:hypothetical protein